MEKSKSIIQDITLLITGCIQPSENQVWLKLVDEQERLKQYLDSIVFYIENTKFNNIVFCENSDYMYGDKSILETLALKNGKKFEWLSFYGDVSLVESFDKGAGESEIVDYALMNSELLKESFIFAKVTGRLKILNCDELLENINLYSNYFIRDIYRFHYKGIDTRFYIANIDFFKRNLTRCYFNTMIKNTKQIGLEECFYILLKRNYKPFRRYPRFQGISGGNGRDYSKLSSMKIFMFNLLCRYGLFNRVFLFTHTFLRITDRFVKVIKHIKNNFV